MSDLDRLAVRNPRKLLEVKGIVVDKALSERIHCPAGEPMIRISMVREGARPSNPSIAWTTEYIPPEWGRLVRISQENPDRLMIDLICSHYRRRCVEVRQTIEATALRGGGKESRCTARRSGPENSEALHQRPQQNAPHHALDHAFRPVRLQSECANRLNEGGRAKERCSYSPRFS